MKKLLLPLLSLALLIPGTARAAGIPDVTVRLVDQAAVLPTVETTTDAMGAFSFVDVPDGSYDVVATTDPLDLDPVDERGASLGLVIGPSADPPSRVAGLVTEDGLATVSFAVSAVVSPMSFIDAGITGARVQHRWNRNWPRSSGKLHVRLAGTGLDAVTQVELTSVPGDPALGTVGTGGSIVSTQLVLDPEDGKLHAIFPKGAAFTTLAGPGAKRGDILNLQVLVTTPAGIQPLEAAVRIVGSRK